jgi:hypothetical protein
MLFEHSFFDNFWDIFFDKNNKGRERERERERESCKFKNQPRRRR